MPGTDIEELATRKPRSPAVRWVFFLIGCLPGFLLGGFVAIFFAASRSIGTYYEWLDTGNRLGDVHLRSIHEPKADLDTMRQFLDGYIGYRMNSIRVDGDGERVVLVPRMIDHYGPIVVRRVGSDESIDGRWHLVMGRSLTYNIARDDAMETKPSAKARP